MIDKSSFLDNDFDVQFALWCPVRLDAGELAQAMCTAIEQKMTQVSVAPDAVKIVWPWMEKSAVKIMGRFYVQEQNVDEAVMSDLVVRINDVFKHGAHGVQLFLTAAMLSSFVEQMYMIRDDLFFDRDLIVGIDLLEIDAGDWGKVFESLQKLKVNAVVFSATGKPMNKADFAGRVYGMLDSWNQKNNFDVHFVLGADLVRIEQVCRLVKVMRPELMQGMKMWYGC